MEETRIDANRIVPSENCCRYRLTDDTREIMNLSLSLSLFLEAGLEQRGFFVDPDLSLISVNGKQLIVPSNG